MQQLRCQDPQQRAQFCDSLASLLAHADEEPYRWALLQQALANSSPTILSDLSSRVAEVHGPVTQ
jgi:hypothetical protein